MIVEMFLFKHRKYKESTTNTCLSLSNADIDRYDCK